MNTSVQTQISRVLAELPERELCEVLDFLEFLRWRVYRHPQPETTALISPAQDIEDSFWQGATLADLAEMQGVQPLSPDQSPWGDFWPEEESLEAFAETVHNLRQAEMVEMVKK